MSCETREKDLVDVACASVKLSPRVRQALREEKRAGETLSEVVERLLCIAWQHEMKSKT
jgi:hypothetical protein